MYDTKKLFNTLHCSVIKFASKCNFNIFKFFENSY